MEVLADLYKVDDPHKMRSSGHHQPQFLHRRDVRFRQSLALDLEFRDAGREHVPLEAGDDLLVDVLDGDEGVGTSCDDVQEEVSPTIGIEVQTVHWLTVTYMYNVYTVHTYTCIYMYNRCTHVVASDPF